MRMRKVTFWMDVYDDDPDPLYFHEKPEHRPHSRSKRYEVTITVPDWLPQGWKDPYAGEAIEVNAEVSP